MTVEKVLPKRIEHGPLRVVVWSSEYVKEESPMDLEVKDSPHSDEIRRLEEEHRH